MNIQKSTAHIKENKKRFIFFLKLFLFILLIVGIEYNPQVKEALAENPGLSNAYRAVIFLLEANILISLGRIITARIYLRKTKEERFHGNFLLGINWISNILNVLVILISLMLAFDIRPLEFLTSLTIVAAAIAILSKDYVTNMINGLIIMFTEQFSLGDTIQVGDQKGIIEDITLLSLVLKTEDNDKIIIPNTLILTSQIINYRMDSLQKLTFEFEIPFIPMINVEAMEQQIYDYVLDFVEDLNQKRFSLNIIAVQKEVIRLQAKIIVDLDQKYQIEKALKQAVIKYTGEINERKFL